MKEHCYEPIVKVEQGWRIDYNPCRHYNTLYITIDTKEILFNGVAYNRFNIQDINYQNGTLYINVGNKLLSCKLPNVTKECPGLMSPLDKQQLDYIFQLLKEGVDSINISNNFSWGVRLEKNEDSQIQPVVYPVTSLEELERLPEGTKKLVSAQLLKDLIDLNGLKYKPEGVTTYTITLVIKKNGNNVFSQQKTVTSEEYVEFNIDNSLRRGYNFSPFPTGVSYSNNVVRVTNSEENKTITLNLTPQEYTITVSGETNAFSYGAFPNRYTIENTSNIIIDFIKQGDYKTYNVTVSGSSTPREEIEGGFRVIIPSGNWGNVEIVLSATEKTSYNIEWRGNGATTAASGGSTSVQEGESITLPNVNPIREYNITWNSNGGSGTIGGSSKATYGFIGWFTEETGGSIVEPNTIPTGNPTGTIIYYAHWNSPTGITLPNTNPTREGYNFGGWAEANNATTSDVDSGTIPTRNITYYAVWNKIVIQKTWYYYAGWTLPTEDNVETIITETYPAASGSSTNHTAGKKTTSKSNMDYTSNTLYNANAKATYYVLVPTGHAIYDSLNNNVIASTFTSNGNITVGNQTHTIYASNSTSRNINAIIIK